MATDAQLIAMASSKLSEIESNFDAISQAIGSGDSYEDNRLERKEVRDSISQEIEKMREQYRQRVLYELLYRKPAITSYRE